MHASNTHELKSKMAPSLVALAFLGLCLGAVHASLPTISCTAGSFNCTVTNAYRSFSDRSSCLVAQVTYPSDEAELLLAVSSAASRNQHMKAVTAYGHSIPKLACPGGPSGSGLAISTMRLNKVVSVQSSAYRMTVEPGMTLREFYDAAAAEGLALPNAPYLLGMTVGGILATGSHGSSFFGKGGTVHEYVVGMRVVVATAAPVDGGLYAKVVDLKEGDEDLLAAKVSLGLLGVISQITFQLEPMFKRSVTYRVEVDEGLEGEIVPFGKTYEFGDVCWFPSQFKAVFREDSRVPVTTEGEGLNALFSALPADLLATLRATEEAQEAWEDTRGKCLAVNSSLSSLPDEGPSHKFYNDRIKKQFLGFPVVGYQSDMQGGSSCLNSSGSETMCVWDRRINGPFLYDTAVTVSVATIAGFVADVMKLRDANPDAFCGADGTAGFVFRYILNSTAYLGKTFDHVDMDYPFYRSHDKSSPRLFEDVLEEVEQMSLFKYGGLPHFGKNRNIAFLGLREKLGAKGDAFVDAMRRFDPLGLFSSDWTDAVLGLGGKSLVVDEPGCALDGMCICSRDEHCAPQKGYLCRPGLIYEDARVCRKVVNVASAL